MNAIDIIMVGLVVSFIFCCICDLSPKVLIGIVLLCVTEVLIILGWEYVHSQTYTTSPFGTCYVDWSGNKVYINEENDHIRIVNYNTPNEVINYYSIDKGDNKEVTAQ